MIKIALKHWIYEKCIDTLFSTISRNFINPVLFGSKKIRELKIGYRFNEIFVMNATYDIDYSNYIISDIKYFNAIVTDIYIPNAKDIKDDRKIGIFNTQAYIVISGVGLTRVHKGIYKDVYGPYGPYEKNRHFRVAVHEDQILYYVRA